MLVPLILRFLSGLAFVALAVTAHAERPRWTLNTLVKDTSLSASTKNEIYSRLIALRPEDVMIRDLVQLRANTWTTIPERQALHAAREFLFFMGLRFGMVPYEFEYFQKHGVLEAPRAMSNIEALRLSLDAERLLFELGIDRIEDAVFMEYRELSQHPLSRSALRLEIAEAFSKAGYPLTGSPEKKPKTQPVPLPVEPPSAEEDDTQELSQEFELAAMPIAKLRVRLSPKLKLALRRAGIVTLGDLSQMTKAQLFALPGLSRGNVYRIGGLMKEMGVRIYQDVIEKAALEGTPLNMALPLRGNVHFERRIGARLQIFDLLEAKGIVTIGELYHADRASLPDHFEMDELLRRFDRLMRESCASLLQ